MSGDEESLPGTALAESDFRAKLAREIAKEEAKKKGNKKSIWAKRNGESEKDNVAKKKREEKRKAAA